MAYTKRKKDNFTESVLRPSERMMEPEREREKGWREDCRVGTN